MIAKEERTEHNSPKPKKSRIRILADRQKLQKRKPPQLAQKTG